jgi:N-acyl-D-aspartate/D-glutamate deacylase
MLSDWRSGTAKLTPLGKSSGAIALDVGSTDEVALLIKMLVDRGMGGGELLQAAHPPEALHRPLSSSQRLMGIFDAVVQPAAGALGGARRRRLSRLRRRSEAGWSR